MEAFNVLCAPSLSSEKLRDIYRWMVLTRVFDTKAINLQRTGKMGTYASILGQEAISVTLGSLMHANDILAPAYREYGAQFQRGVAMSDILRYWGGDERGNAFDHPRDFPICVPIATQCLHAVGARKLFNCDANRTWRFLRAAMEQLRKAISTKRSILRGFGTFRCFFWLTTISGPFPFLEKLKLLRKPSLKKPLPQDLKVASRWQRCACTF